MELSPAAAPMGNASKTCRGCRIWESKKGTAAWETGNANHKCKINHVKSSGSMESTGAVEIFGRSVAQNGLIAPAGSVSERGGFVVSRDSEV